MNRRLKIVDYWYGEEARQKVFEPLIADFDSDVRASRSIATRLRWWWAFATTFVVCLPRATFSGLPARLIADLSARIITFGVLGILLQWLAGAGGSKHIPGLWPPSPATTLPLVIVPVVWRIRVSHIPPHQRRLLAMMCGAIFTIGSIASSATVALALANSVGMAWLTLVGWKAADPERARLYPITQTFWFRIIGPATSIIVATWPVRLALGLSLRESLGGFQLIAFGAGVLIALSTRHASQGRTVA